MKKTLLLTSLLLALSSAVALAGGVNLAWGTLCYTEGVGAPPATGLVASTFACNTNGAAGNRQLTTSFVLDNVMTDMVGCEMWIIGQSDTPALPDYWKLGIAPSTDCRAGRASYVSNFQAVLADPVVCDDWTGGAGFNAPNMTWSVNRAHFNLGVAIDDGFPFTAQPGVEYYSGAVTLLNNLAVGPGSCEGCSVGMMFALNLVTAAGKAGRRDDFTTPISGGNQCVTWNNPTTMDCAGVPARTTTWGQIKSLYR